MSLNTGNAANFRGVDRAQTFSQYFPAAMQSWNRESEPKILKKIELCCWSQKLESKLNKYRRQSQESKRKKNQTVG